MIKFGKNKYLSALKNLILFSASIHILLLIIYSVIKLDITHLNYFNILDFDLFFPNIISNYSNCSYYVHINFNLKVIVIFFFC